MNRFTCGILITFAALISLTLQLRFIPIIGMGAGFETVSIARSLAVHGTFADPFDEPTGPTAHVAPLYPLLLAGILRVTPNEEYFRVAALCLTLAAHVLNIWLMFWLANELFDRVTAMATVAIGILVPLYQVMPGWETIDISCGVIAFWLVARRRSVVLAGALGGALLLLNPATVLILLPVAVCEWRRVKSVSLFLGVTLIVIVPWSVRNYRTFHKLFFIRDNLGLELDLYNNGCEAFGTAGCAPHPVSSAAERQRIRDLGETAYYDMRMSRALAWMRSHPGAELRLILRRVAGFWFPASDHPPFGWCISILTLASLWGFLCLWRARASSLWPMLAISALYPLVYYLVGVDLRYRYPILWISVFAAAYGIREIAARARSVQKLHYHAHTDR